MSLRETSTPNSTTLSVKEYREFRVFSVTHSIFPKLLILPKFSSKNSSNNYKIPQFCGFYLVVSIFYTNFVAICAFINVVRKRIQC